MLAEILEAIETEFAKLTSGVQWKVGAEHLGGNDKPPRVVCIPLEDAYQAPEQHLDEISYSGPRALAGYEATVAFHVWGKDWSKAEDLRDALVNALRSSALAAMRLVRGEWVQQDGAAVTQAGRVYVLTVSFMALVLETPSGVATVTSTEEDVAVEPVP